MTAADGARYRWVLTKLVLNLVLTGLVVVALGPEVTRLAEQAVASRPASWCRSTSAT